MTRADFVQALLAFASELTRYTGRSCYWWFRLDYRVVHVQHSDLESRLSVRWYRQDDEQVDECDCEQIDRFALARGLERLALQLGELEVNAAGLSISAGERGTLVIAVQGEEIAIEVIPLPLISLPVASGRRSGLA